MEIAKEYIISDPEDLLECPYEPSHMVRAKRMQYHIMKCRKNHVCTEFKRCPFNALHEVYATELRYHMAVCEDRHRVDGKIAQECFDNGDLKGCIETPCYKPLDICGDSWETGIPFNPQLAAAEQHLPENVEEDSAEEELIVTEAEKEGLSSRQLKQLYLEKKKAREKQQEEMQKKAMLGEKLRVPRQPSQSLYIHHQQQTRQQQDIYDQVLRNQSNRVTAFGRGQGLPVLQQAKVGGGTSASIVGSLADGKMGPLIATTGREGEAENLGLGRSKIAFSPRGKGQASGMGIMGQGFGQEDDHTCFMEVPFDQLASQPNHQVAYITNGNKTSMLNSSIHQQQFDSSEESDSGDPLPWVGGGYGEAAEMPASSSSSNISLVSQLITGSWAEEVEKTIPIVNSEVTSESSGSDLQESDKVLSKAEAIKKVRKIKKHLKQIDELEMKMRRGRTLEPEAESKWRRKEALIAEAAYLQQTFNLP